MNAVLRFIGITLPFYRRVDKRRYGLCLLLMLVVNANAIAAFTRETEDRALLGRAVLALNFSDGRPEVIAPQLHSKVDIHVTGPIARVRVKQIFSNPSDSWAEALYTFPLPPDSAVDQLQIHLGERIIEGEIHERKTAQKIFQQARQDGQQAALVEQHRANIFSTNVANVPPGEELTVVIEYQQQVIRRGSRFSLHYPMSITPRYSPRSQDNQTGAETNDKPLTQLAASLPGINRAASADISRGKNNNATEIWLDLQAGFELDDVESRYHFVSKHRIDDSHWQLRLHPQTHLANADFVVEWQGREVAVPQAHIFSQTFAGQEYALLQVMPPQVELEQTRQPRDIVYVIDTSGSMGGESLRQAKRALLWAIDRLDEQDRFNIIEFNSQAWSLFDAEREANSQNISRARRFVKALEARGGTEMRKAMDLALCGHCVDKNSTERMRQVMFLTDGAISNEATLFAAIKRQLGNSRLFTVGIGSAPNRYFMRKAAKMGRGTFVDIGKISEVEEKLTQLFERIDAPLMNDIELQFVADNLDISPARIPDLYATEPLVVAIKADDLPEQITLQGRRQGKVWQQRLSLANTSKYAGIHVAWARKKIESLFDDRAMQSEVEQRDALRHQMLAIGLKHHLVTPFTSLVAVDKKPLKPESEALNHHVIQNNVPKGTRFGLARTATGMTYFLGMGCVVLMLAIGLLWLSRCYAKNTCSE